MTRVSGSGQRRRGLKQSYTSSFLSNHFLTTALIYFFVGAGSRWPFSISSLAMANPCFLRTGQFFSMIKTMARKKGNGNGKKKSPAANIRPPASGAWHAMKDSVRPETKQSIFAILCFLGAVLFVLSYIGKGGSAGGLLFRVFSFLLGAGYFFVPLMFVVIGFSLLYSGPRRVMSVTLLGGFLFLFVSFAGLHVVFGSGTGGVVGSLLGAVLLKLFDFWASVVILAGLLGISLLLMLNLSLTPREKALEADGGDDIGADGKDGHAIGEGASGITAMLENMNAKIQSVLEKKSEEPAPAAQAEITSRESRNASEEPSLALRKVAKKFTYQKPPLELLQGDRGKPSSGDIRANANIIKRTLENFGIEVEMGEIAIGPTVTQYTLRPAEGVKLSRIIGLHNDLSLALAAHPIRIEAPIPGKSLVGIEVPNRSIALVGLRALLEHPTFQDSPQPLMIALGRDVAGMPVYGDLARMPHLLISGATGSGKSVAAHSIITSFLYRNPPELLRFILVDPKRVELSVYNDIPHLLTPVITDPKTTIQALRWATKEMDRRYELLSQKHARDIASFNAETAKDSDGELLPYIVIMIDELADLMAMFPREVEHSIIRLAQMARAVGIHLIVATQRPSVEVITGLIKANITSRMAFQVASQIDSRTILDMAGAEKLLGNGDMLFLAGDTAKPRRIQGGYVSEQEVKRVVDFLREESVAPGYEEGILETKLDEGGRGNGELGDDDGDDPLYGEARALVIDAGKASASYLQRRLRVGYARAARLLDILEQEGVIGPGEGAKPREVLVKTSDYLGEEVMES